MPTRPPVHQPFDPRHGAVQVSDRERGSASARGYDRLWRKFRLQFLASNPLCADCLKSDVIAPATEPHHKQKLADRPDLRLDPANVMALCKTCHSLRTARGE
jgi:5-methylcytosine-specific restriction protein A